MTDPLCVRGHRASHHDTPDSGDTRRLAVEARDDLINVFDDARDTADGHCACLRFTEARPDPDRGRDDTRRGANQRRPDRLP